MTDVTINRTLKLKGKVCTPPSKSYTQRMVLAAALSQGTSKISNPLIAQDSEAILRAITAFGAKTKISEDCWKIEGTRQITTPTEPVDCGESGATLRFMVPVAALTEGSSTLLFRGSLERRPIDPLLKSLSELGAQAEVTKVGDKDAVKVFGGGIKGGKTQIAGNVSSQFISGLMFACPMAQNDTEITLTTPLESKDYVKMTAEVLAQHKIRVHIKEDFSQIIIPAKQTYKPHSSRVPGDFSSAAFLLAASAITDSKVKIENLPYQTAQGDRAILEILKRMGVEEKVSSGYVEIRGTGGYLKATDVDASNIPDLVPACVVLACYARGISKIYNAGRLRLKESDRLTSLYIELKNMGADIVMDEDSLTIRGPSMMYGAMIDAHNDHRIAMACAVAALRAEGETIIKYAQCVRKSYPQFFIHLKQLGADVVGGKFDR
ncbi:MAG: 3-phosphoshikimate 1-carboxyvinyltransferase [Candidatus Bathyarchaeota archaeon]|nr:3-phosphoshikimate 1-carboxyvinyltransferase [Candidatus Bathyarchaeota archaeon]